MDRLAPAIRTSFVALSLVMLGAFAPAASSGAAPVSGCGPSSWFVVSSPSPGSLENYLYDVTGLAAFDAWAVGTYSESGRLLTLTEHFDDTGTWSVVPSPNAPNHNTLFGVDGISSADVWAVGNSSVDAAHAHTLVERWDGKSWTIVASPNPGAGFNTLYSVAAVAADDVWAVGTWFAGGPQQTLIEHWDGASWKVVASPNPPNANNLLADLWAVAADDVWAVGTSNSTPFILHWDGNAWSVAPTPPLRAHGYLWDVTASSSQDVWAVGSIGVTRTRTLIVHWDGKSWSRVASPNPGDRTNVLTGVASYNETSACAIGEYRASHEAPQPLFERWNGSVWSSIFGPARTTIYKVSALPDGHAWIVGWTRTSTGIKTLIEQPCLPCAR